MRAVAAGDFVGHPDVGGFALAVGDGGVVVADVRVVLFEFGEWVDDAFEWVLHVVVAELNGGEVVGCAGDCDDAGLEVGRGRGEEERFEEAEEIEVGEMVGGELGFEAVFGEFEGDVGDA